ncbi:MAG: adenylosuccinate synthase [Nanoarchaeota archaeon]|nr:adenylosuccinate synthase [Nanoarchaeota archaeon]
MPAVCVIGSQWGDEGKGKVVDVLGENADYVVRWQGGNNAGHTVVFDGNKYTFHALPTGVLRNIRSLMATEVVLDPRQLVKEIQNLNRKVNLGIDPRTGIIMPWHNYLDIAIESHRKKQTGAEIGTTGRGIGPAYADDISRSGIRFFELVGSPKKLEERIKSNYEEAREIIHAYNTDTKALMENELKLKDVLTEYKKLGRALKKYETNVSKEINGALKKNKKVIFEGAQGTLLDLKFGNYPKVTSSHPMSGSIFPSVGIPPMKLRTIGIVKAYVTKVGSGPVVTCLDKGLWPVDESKSTPEANYIRQKGNEKGATTGRLRRVGWLDLVALKYTHSLNGFSEFALTKLDVLSGMEKIFMAVGYKHNCKMLDVDDYESWDLDFLNKCSPVYEEFDGFGDISQVRTLRQLPKNAKKCVKTIEEIMDVPITLISVGPGREETIYRGFKKFS